MWVVGLFGKPNQWSCFMACYRLMYRGKHRFDGAKNIEDMIARLKRTIAELQEMKKAGVKLEEEARDDDPMLVTGSAKVARKFGFMEEADPNDPEPVEEAKPAGKVPGPKAKKVQKPRSKARGEKPVSVPVSTRVDSQAK
jgi:hypothetical protein